MRAAQVVQYYEKTVGFAPVVAEQFGLPVLTMVGVVVRTARPIVRCCVLLWAVMVMVRLSVVLSRVQEARLVHALLLQEAL